MVNCYYSAVFVYPVVTTPEPNTEISEDDFPAQFLCDIFSLLDEVMVNTSWFIDGAPIALFSSNVTFELSGERTRNLTILSGFPTVISCGVPQDVFLASFTIIGKPNYFTVNMYIMQPLLFSLYSE